MSPSQMGRYALVKKIGRGGMADVWIGKVHGAGGFEKIVAIKLLSPDQVDKEEYQRALTDEARIQAHLKHPNIVDVYDLNFEAENPYLVMEYVEGVELRDLLKTLRKEGRRLSLDAAGFIVLEVATALQFAHERKNRETGEPLQIVHRDVSPSNVLLSLQGDVKLSDFGIAKSALQSAATQVGQIKGKFRYMSPEQAEGAKLDHRSDMFSLGLVFYECLFGTPAYDDPSDVGILKMARSGQVMIPSETPPELRTILERLLAGRPEDRYPELRECKKELSDFLRKTGQALDREGCSQYLQGLRLKQFQEAATLRREAAEWSPQSMTQVLDQTGRIVTLAKVIPPLSRRRSWATAGAVLLVLFAVALIYTFGPRGTERPAAPTKDAPPSLQAAAVTTDKPQAAPEIQKTQNLQVNFSADPYAEVTIPGVLTDKETPFSRKLPAGNYKILFRHATSGHETTAMLKGAQGGSFVCFANMALSAPDDKPTASCRAR